ncbi:MAG: hypothetical protein WC647_19095 [Desulfomonilaceae bacterium]|jgi:hypothetical protein
MISRPSILEPQAEALVLTTDKTSKNIILAAFEVQGLVDISALKSVVSEIGHFFPEIGATLKEFKNNGRYYLGWDFQRMLDIPLFVTDVNGKDMVIPGFDTLIKYLEPRLNRERDIFREPACEFHDLRLGANRHILACILWHPSGDAVRMAEIVKTSVARYHELVCGGKASFSDIPASVSTGDKRSIQTGNTRLTDYWRTACQAIIPYRKCSLPYGVGVTGDENEHHVKRVFSVRESTDIVLRAKKTRVPFVDYLLAAMALSIERWNDTHKVDTSVISAALTVNMQGRLENYQSPNNDSVIYFRFSREQRKDPVSFARQVFRFRLRKFREGADLKYIKGLSKLNHLFKLLPFHFRQNAYVKILSKHQTSFALGFIGVLWPESQGRKITGDSYLKSVGGLDFIEAHGMAYRIFSGTPLYLTAYFFQKRLNLILSAQPWKFQKNEAQDFLDLLSDTNMRFGDKM